MEGGGGLFPGWPARANLDWVANLHGSRSYDVAIEREEPVELAMDSEEHLHVLHRRVRVERRHDASAPQADHSNDGSAYVEVAALPIALGKPGHAADEEVRPKASRIVGERRDRTVGGHQQGKDVELLGAIVAHEVRSRTGGFADVISHVIAGPSSPIDPRLSVSSERRVVKEKVWARAGRNDPSPPVLDVNDPVSRDSFEADGCFGKGLSSHRLYGVPPELGEPHAGCSMPDVRKRFAQTHRRRTLGFRPFAAPTGPRI